VKFTKIMTTVSDKTIFSNKNIGKNENNNVATDNDNIKNNDDTKSNTNSDKTNSNNENINHNNSNDETKDVVNENGNAEADEISLLISIQIINVLHTNDKTNKIDDNDDRKYEICISTNHGTWVIKRSLNEFRRLDHYLRMKLRGISIPTFPYPKKISQCKHANSSYQIK